MKKLNLISSFWRNRDKFRDIFTIENWQAFLRMSELILKGKYRPMKMRNLLIGFLALIYLISPIDIIPEIAFGPFGLIDDMVILAFALKKIHKEILNFLEWENKKQVLIEG